MIQLQRCESLRLKIREKKGGNVQGGNKGCIFKISERGNKEKLRFLF